MWTRSSIPASALLTLLLCAIGCRDASVAGIAADKPHVPTPIVPAIPERATIYKLVGNPTIRYLVYDADFKLQYGNYPAYVGSSTRADSIITFDFWPGGPPSWCREAWCKTFLATGALRTDTMFVQYDRGSAWLLCNDMMDFEVCASSSAVFVQER